MKKHIKTYSLILLGAFVYAASTVVFIFPHGLLLGGTSGISVILQRWIPFSPATILMVINLVLLGLAFLILGNSMAVKTLVGSIVTTGIISFLEPPVLWLFPTPLIPDPVVSALVGAGFVALASGLMFYVDSSSGGTDIIALILRKYSSIDIGKALLITDVLIVIVGGILSGWLIGLSSFVGLLIKTLGIDLVIRTVKSFIKRHEQHNTYHKRSYT